VNFQCMKQKIIMSILDSLQCEDKTLISCIKITSLRAVLDIIKNVNVIL
jgi:hypothetical protein